MSDEYNEAIPGIVKAYYEESGLSYHALGEIIGRAGMQVMNWAKGKNRPDDEAVERMIDLGILPDDEGRYREPQTIPAMKVPTRLLREVDKAIDKLVAIREELARL